jgi:hypothetical protein
MILLVKVFIVCSPCAHAVSQYGLQRQKLRRFESIPIGSSFCRVCVPRKCHKKEPPAHWPTHREGVLQPISDNVLLRAAPRTKKSLLMPSAYTMSGKVGSRGPRLCPEIATRAGYCVQPWTHGIKCLRVARSHCVGSSALPEAL